MACFCASIPVFSIRATNHKKKMIARVVLERARRGTCNRRRRRDPLYRRHAESERAQSRETRKPSSVQTCYAQYERARDDGMLMRAHEGGRRSRLYAAPESELSVRGQ